MIRVIRPGGRLIIVDAGEAYDGNPIAHLLAQTWDALGDYIRDETPLMTSRGLTVTRQNYGPFESIHMVVGLRPG